MLTLSCRHYSTDLTLKMRLNISVAKHLRICVVPEARCSLASCLRPRWVVKAPEQNPQCEVGSFERGPQKHLESNCQGGLLLLRGGRGGGNFPLFLYK